MHASVVTCDSKYFQEMLESGSWSVELHEVRPRVLEHRAEVLAAARHHARVHLEQLATAPHLSGVMNDVIRLKPRSR